MNSLFIGRWQPLHKGHVTLIRKVLDEEKKPVVIGIRDTTLSSSNPYTVEERIEMIKKEFGNTVRTVVIPDIAEICYGRDVGYKIREIDLDEKTKGISATNIRKGKVWWITGNSGAGKTTLALQFKDAIILDGDDLRKVWTLGFSKEDRWEQNIRVAKLANILKNQGKTVVISTICPYKKLREEVQQITNCVFVYLSGGQKSSKEFPYEHD